MKVEQVTNLKRQATKILADLHVSKEPVLITEYGKASAYLVDVDDYEMMQHRIELVDGIVRGEAAYKDERILSHSEARKLMKKWLNSLDTACITRLKRHRRIYT